MRTTISLVPIGPVSAELLLWLADRLGEVFGRQVVLGETLPLLADPGTYGASSSGAWM